MSDRTSGQTRRGASDDTADALARGLGWFSIGLGLAELLAPRAVAGGAGIKPGRTLLRTYGLREIAAGIGILAARDRAPWIWGRVGGDALDLATLVSGFARRNSQKGRLSLAFAAVAGVTALDVICAQSLDAIRKRPHGPVRDYSDRSGFPKPAEAMRGVARDFAAPHDMRVPEAMRPYATQ